jgi:hypothetical protein
MLGAFPWLLQRFSSKRGKFIIEEVELLHWGFHLMIYLELEDNDLLGGFGVLEVLIYLLGRSVAT